MGLTVPTAAPQQVGPQLSEEEIRRKHAGEIGRLITHHVLNSFDSEHVYLYLELRRNYAFYKGNYEIAPSAVGGVVDYRRVNSGNLNVSHSSADESLYDYVCNIFRGDGRKLVAVVGQRPPNVQAGPRTPNNEEQVERARKAQMAADFWHDAVDSDELQRRLVFSLGVAGTTFGYVRYVADKSRYGETKEPIWEDQEITIEEESFACPTCERVAPLSEAMFIDRETNMAQCPGCEGAAEIQEAVTESIAIQTDEFDTFQNGGVEMDIVNGLHVTTEPNKQSLRHTGWLIYEYEEDRGRLLEMYPELREKSRLPSFAHGRDELGATARNEASSLFGLETPDSAHTERYSRFWLRPWMYNHIDDERVRVLFEESFPNGIKITSVAGYIVKLEPESMDEVWVECKPDQDEGLWVPGYLTDMVQCAEIVNDALRILIELMEKGIPINLTNPKVIDPELLRERGRRVGEFVPAMKDGMHGSFKDAIHTIKASEIDSQLSQIIDVFITLYRQAVTGLTPAVYGGGNYNTAREAEIARSQALAMLSTLWSNTRTFWKRASLLAVRQLAKYTDGTLHRPDGDEHDALSIEGFEDVLNGGYSFTASEAFPMTPAQVADKIMSIFEANNHELAEKLGLYDPENTAIETAIGIPGWKMPQTKARQYVMGIIKRLLEEGPMVRINQMTGQPEKVSSVAANDIVVDPQLALQIIRSWIYEDGVDAEFTNPEGFLNVLLYAEGYKMMLMPPPAPGMEGPAGGAPPPAAIDPASVPGPTEGELPMPDEVPEPAITAVQ